MPKPVLMTVDDDPGVSRSVARDLRRRYGQDHRVVRAESGGDALEALRELTLRGEPVAAILADYRIPGMNDIDTAWRCPVDLLHGVGDERGPAPRRNSPPVGDWWLHITRKAIQHDHLVHHGRLERRGDPDGDQTRLVHSTCRRALLAQHGRKPASQPRAP